MKTLRLLIFLALAVAAAGFAVVFVGLYDVSATDQHLRPTYWVLSKASIQAIKLRARGVSVPPLDDPELSRRGLAVYREHCVRCHGAPGVAPEPFALGMTPVPANLAYTGKEWKPAAVYWVVKYGMKMTGMPAWKFRLSDRDIWAVVAFTASLPRLSPRDYAELTARQVAEHHDDRQEVSQANASRGREAVHQYACLTCHRIPGLVGPNAPVGPPLEHVGTRKVIAGVVPNTPENMVRWLLAPQELNPGTAMPDLGLSERDARDIAAFLEQLK